MEGKRHETLVIEIFRIFRNNGLSMEEVRKILAQQSGEYDSRFYEAVNQITTLFLVEGISIEEGKGLLHRCLEVVNL